MIGGALLTSRTVSLQRIKEGMGYKNKVDTGHRWRRRVAKRRVIDV